MRAVIAYSGRPHDPSEHASRVCINPTAQQVGHPRQATAVTIRSARAAGVAAAPATAATSASSPSAPRT